MAVDTIYWLDQIQSSERSAVGDKAFYLGLLLQRAYPVVPGLVIPAATYQDFLSHVDWQEQMFADLPYSSLYVDTNNPRQLQVVAQQIQRAIREAPLPEALLHALLSYIQQWDTAAVIFRPSLCLQPELDPTVVSKATGLLQSQICPVEPGAIAQGLKQMWAELFRARSLFYWQHLGIQLQQVQLAVLVQPIGSVIAAGDLTITEQQVQVQATWGLGHALIQGDGVADRYSMNLQSGALTQQIGRKLHTYQITLEPTVDATFSTWLTAAQPCLQLQLIESEQQSAAVLTVEQFQQLTQWGQQIQADLKIPLQLEWIFSAVAPALTQFQFTQAMPQLDLIRPAAQRFASRPQRTAQPAPLERAHILGLAAAPGQVVAEVWRLDADQRDLTQVPAGVILVAPNLTPEQVIRLRQVSGIVTEQGGMTSHAAILARELGIPAIVGATQATQLLQTGNQVALDGDQGVVYYGQLDPSILQTFSAAPVLTLPSAEQSRAFHPVHPSRKIQLLVTLSQPDHLPQMATSTVDGVGLLRAELLLLKFFAQQPPSQWLHQHPANAIQEIRDCILPFVKAFAPRPVLYRSLDFRAAEFSTASDGITHQSMLGMRGTLGYQADPVWFQTELTALRQVQQQGYPNLRLLLPFVRTVEEFTFCRQQVERAGLTQDAQFQLWIMAEVPSVLFLLADYVAAGVQGIVIGTHDLTQLLLGVDRDHPQLATAFNPYHPVVLKAIQQLIQTARQLNIPCTLCPQALEQHPDFISTLIKWGITGISVEPSALSLADELIRGRG